MDADPPRSLSELVIALYARKLPGLPERGSDGYWWNYVPELAIPPERWIHEQVDDPGKVCGELFGGKPAACVGYYAEEEYPLARIITGRNPSPSLLEHEERHAKGWFHPSQSLLRKLLDR